MTGQNRLRRVLSVGVMLIATSAVPGHAAESDARSIALGANCKPAKIEVLKQTNGVNGETVYKVACADGKDRFVLVQCRDRTCIFVR